LLSSEKIGYAKIDKGEAIEFNLTPNEIVYGGGARALGMNRRGNRLTLYNKAHYGYENKSELMNYTLPIVFSSEKYLIHF
jgi:alpha-glucosidase (family GH31 glycosyl hydrolase)